MHLIKCALWTLEYSVSPLNEGTLSIRHCCLHCFICGEKVNTWALARGIMSPWHRASIVQLYTLRVRAKIQWTPALRLSLFRGFQNLLKEEKSSKYHCRYDCKKNCRYIVLKLPITNVKICSLAIAFLKIYLFMR